MYINIDTIVTGRVNTLVNTNVKRFNTFVYNTGFVEVIYLFHPHLSIYNSFIRYYVTLLKYKTHEIHL